MQQKKSRLKYPDMVAKKLLLRFQPFELGIYYHPTRDSSKKKIYIIKLSKLLKLKNPDQITKQIYSKHYHYISEDKVPFKQLYQLIENILSIQQQQIKDSLQLNIGGTSNGH